MVRKFGPRVRARTFNGLDSALKMFVYFRVTSQHGERRARDKALGHRVSFSTFHTVGLSYVELQ